MCRRGHRHKSTGFDLIRDDGVIAAMQLTDTLDTDHVHAGASDARAHTVQEVRDVNDVRFLRDVLHHGPAFRKCGGQHDVDCRAH